MVDSELTQPGVRARRPLRAAARSIRDRPAFVALLGGLVLGTAAWWIPGWRTTGRVPYVVDDAWIHLTIVRNLRDHGTFGVVPGVYESASSAPLWNVLLTPLSFLPVPLDWWPILVNLAAAAWILWRVSSLPVVMRLADRSTGLVALVVLPVALGLPQIAATGMEHLLQAAVALEILRGVVDRVGDGPSRPVLLPVLAFAGTLLRFETAFLVATACVAMVLLGPRRTVGRRVRASLPLALAPVAAVASFAAVNVSFGQSVLPNSVLAKSASTSIVQTFGDNLSSDPWLPLLMAITAVVAARAWAHGMQAVAAAGFVAMATALLHLALADVGNFARYQEWLVVLLGWSVLAALDVAPGRAATGTVLSPARPRTSPAHLTSTWLVAAAIVLLATPKLALLFAAPTAAEDIYLLQEQTARFLDEYHDTDGVGLHDLGWVAWLHDGPIVDLAGLSSHEVMLGIRSDTYDRTLVGRLFDEADVSVVATYDGLFDAVLPAGWEPAGTWCVRTPRVVLSADCFSFYGATDAARDDLRAELEAFRGRLPDGIVYQPR